MPDDRRMTISSSSHLSPDEVARHDFSVSRRGFAPEEVRAYLESVAHSLRALAERENDFRRELEEAEQRAANPIVNEETLMAVLGQETTRVLQSARQASNEMMAKAAAESDRLLTDAREEIAATEFAVAAQLSERAAEAEAEAAECRRQAEEDAAAMVHEARTQAEGMLDQARSDCRGMVEEAQALRTRVLADLSKRRKVLHAQIDQLRAGRENLANAVRGVRLSIDAIADDLFRAEDDARLAAETAGRQAIARSDEGTPEEFAAALFVEEAVAERALIEEGTTEPDEEKRFEEVSMAAVPELLHDQKADQLSGPTHEKEDEQPGDREPTPDPADPKPSVDALFAKIRASRADTDTETDTDTDTDTDTERYEPEGESDGQPPHGRNPFALRRDEMVAPMLKSLARRMKRTLQDDQNELLDRLRSSHFKWSIDMLASESEHYDAYSTAALPHLEETAQAGASFMGSEGIHGTLTNEMLGIAHDLAETVVGPLRQRLGDGDHLDGADEAAVAEHVGSAYRDWKGERIERLAADFVVAAFSIGSLNGAESRENVCIEWIADSASGGEPCPDCEDNVLNGPHLPGGTFPTGHIYPPAHPGCRCLLTVSTT